LIPTAELQLERMLKEVRRFEVMLRTVLG